MKTLIILILSSVPAMAGVDPCNALSASSTIPVCQQDPVQMASWTLELSTTTAAIVSLGTGYIGANAITQVNYNSKLVRITQLRSLLGLQ